MVGWGVKQVAKAVAECKKKGAHCGKEAASSADNDLSNGSGKRFECEYSCAVDGNFMYSGGSTAVSKRTVSAKDKYEAERMIEKSLREGNDCKGKKSSSGLSLTPKAVCHD